MSPSCGSSAVGVACFPPPHIPNKSPEGRICADITRGTPAMKLLNRQIKTAATVTQYTVIYPTSRHGQNMKKERKKIEEKP